MKLSHAKRCQPAVSIHSPHWTSSASTQIPTIIISETDIEIPWRSMQPLKFKWGRCGHLFCSTVWRSQVTSSLHCGKQESVKDHLGSKPAKIWETDIAICLTEVNIQHSLPRLVNLRWNISYNFRRKERMKCHYSQKKKKKKKPSVRSACDSSAHKVWEYLTENQLPRFKWYVLINSFAKKAVTLHVCFSTVPISLCSFLQYWQLAKFKRQPN